MSVVGCTVASWLANRPIHRATQRILAVKVYAGTDPLTGREIRLRRTCKTERAAQIELGKLLEQASAGRQPKTNATVAELMDRYTEVADWDLSTRKANEMGHRWYRSSCAAFSWVRSFVAAGFRFGRCPAGAGIEAWRACPVLA